MTQLLDAKMAGEPSDPDFQLSDAPEPSSTPADVDPAASSSEAATDQDAEPTSVFDVVKRAAEEQGEGEEASSTSEDGEAPSAGEGEGQGQQEDDGKSSESGDPEQQPDDYSDVPFHKHPRFQQLVKERNELRQQAQGMQTDAQAFQAVRSFAEENGLDNTRIADALTSAAEFNKAGVSREEVQELVRAGVALKQGDFQTFARIVQPRFEQAQHALGQAFPQDLQQKVNDGVLDEDTAREVAMLRAQRQVGQQQLQQSQEQRQQEQARLRQTQMQTEVAKWEEGERQRDPDFDKLSDLRMTHARALIAQHGAPTNPAEARELAQVAHQRAKRDAGRLAPPRQTAPTPKSPSGSTTSTEPAPEPTSVQDAIFAAARAKG